MLMKYILWFLSWSIITITHAQLPESLANYKYEVAHKVFAQLVQAKGDKTKPPPQFQLVATDLYAAYRKDTMIGLEELAYDICTTLGKDSLNALAAVLGHELIHYYNHSEANKHHDFMGNYYELEADYAGGFLAYSAGYSTFGLMPKLLDAVYDWYGTGDSMEGYLTKSERKKLAKKAEVYSQQLVQLFQMSNYLALLSKYKEAAYYMTYILQTYKSRELYNNVGVNLLLEVMQMVSSVKEPFQYPLILETTTNIVSRGEPQTTKTIRPMVNQAIGFLERAITLDPTYASSYLNLGCAYSLKAQYDSAQYYIQEVQKYDTNHTLTPAIYLLQGILHAKQERYKIASQFFKKAQASTTYEPMATTNFKTLYNIPQPYFPEPERPLLKLETFYQNDQPIDLLSFIRPNLLTDTFHLYHKKPPIISRLQTNDRLTIISQNQASKAVNLVVGFTQANYKAATTNGLYLQDNLEKVQQIYGKPERIHATPQGSYWVYDYYGIIFLIQEGRVWQWCLYELDN